MTMKGRQASWSMVLMVIVLATLSVVVTFCWPVQASQPAHATSTPTIGSVFVVPTMEPTLPIVTTPPGHPHLTATPRLPATPTAVVIVPTPIPPLQTATPDVMPLEIPTMRPMPTGGVPPVQAPRR